MSAVADVASGTIRVEVEIAATPERVFQSLTTPEELASWWGSDGMYRTFDWRLDLRPGGEWSCRALNAGGEESDVRGQYLTIDPPRVLEYTWQPSWDGHAETRIRIELASAEGGTRLTLMHSGFGDRTDACREHAEGWTRVTAWLTAYLAET